mmetsp:Transcript_24106/g.43451  ORF Transcript_24106/g.43451 Transcript_24106/m.43451 type:complete len:116 (-) Transcript_24106:4-351(-)
MKQAVRVPEPVPGQCFWSGGGVKADVRLAKVIRSLWIFRERAYMESMQAFAWDLQANEKRGRSFTYGGTCLDEILYMEHRGGGPPPPDLPSCEESECGVSPSLQSPSDSPRESQL